MNKITHQNHTILTQPGWPLQIYHSLKPYTYILPTSFKGHITASLIARIEAICDSEPGEERTFFYICKHYAHFSSLQEQGIIVKDFPNRFAQIERVVGMLSKENRNEEADEELIKRLSAGKFTTPEHIKKINKIFDKGASEQILIADVGNRKSLNEFKLFIELMVDRSGTNVFDSYFLANINSSTFLNFSKKFKGGTIYSLARFLACQFLNSANLSELKDKVEACSKLLNLDYIRSEFASLISINSKPILFEAFIKAKTLNDFGNLSILAKEHLSPEKKRLLKNMPFFPLREFASSVNTAILDLSSVLDDDSPFTDTVIIVNDQRFYGNSTLLSFQSGYFAQARGLNYLLVRDEKNRRVFDLTEECKDPNVFFVLNYMLGNCPLDYPNNLSRYFLLKAALFFDNAYLKDVSGLSLDFVHSVDEILIRFEKKDAEGVVAFLESKYKQKSEVVLVALELLYPGITAILQQNTQFKFYLKKYCTCLIEFDHHYSPTSLADMLKKIRDRFHFTQDYIVLTMYYVTQVLCLNEEEFVAFKSLVENEIDDPVKKSYFQKSFLNRIKEDPNLQNVKVVWGERIFLSNHRYLKYFGGAIGRLPVSSKGVINLLQTYPEDPKLFEIICEVFLEVELSWPEDLRGKADLGSYYELLGLKIPHQYPTYKQKIMKYYTERDFETLKEFLNDHCYYEDKLQVAKLVESDIKRDPSLLKCLIPLYYIIRDDWKLRSDNWTLPFDLSVFDDTPSSN